MCKEGAIKRYDFDTGELLRAYYINPKFGLHLPSASSSSSTNQRITLPHVCLK